MWVDVYLLILDNRGIAMRSIIRACRKRYQLKDCNIITLTRKSRFEITGQELANLSLHSKLIIVSHGDENTLRTSFQGLINHFELFELLLDLGLREAGVISFKACNIGSGFFLEKFKSELCSDMKIGYLLAYKSYSIEIWGHEGIGCFDTSLRFFSCGLLKLPDSFRVKIIKGNAKIEGLEMTKRRWLAISTI